MTGHCAPIPKPDPVIYLVLCRYRDGDYWAERDAVDTDRATTIEHIRTGNLPNVQQVIEIEFVPAEHRMSSRDVTEDMLAAAHAAREPDTIETSLERLRGMLIDHDRDLARDGIFGWPS